MIEKIAEGLCIVFLGVFFTVPLMGVVMDYWMRLVRLILDTHDETE